MKNLNLTCFIYPLISVAILSVTPLSVIAAQINYQFTAAILNVAVDNGSGIYSGTAVDDLFTGSFRYSSDPNDSFLVENFPTQVSSDWLFKGGSFGGMISNGTTSTNTTGVRVGTDSNFAVEVGAESVLFNDALVALGKSPIANIAGTLFDVWDTNSENFDNNGDPLGGVSFGVSLISFNTALYTGSDFEPIPLSLLGYDIPLFFLGELDANGVEIFSAYGILNTTVVPIPAAVWLFGSGILGLVGKKRLSR